MDSQQIEKLIISLTQCAQSQLSDSRYEHSCRVAAFAEYLAQHYRCTFKQQRLCFLTGIAHDICKEMPMAGQLRLVQAAGLPVRKEDCYSTELLHGPAAAVLVRERFGIHKTAVLHAIQYHTIGSLHFDSIGKIVYISDKIEPGRKNCEYLRKKMPMLSLDELFFVVLGEVMHFLETKGQHVHPYTKKVYDTLQKKKRMEEKEIG